MIAGNLAVVALFVLGWAHVRYWLRHSEKPVRIILFGVTMGSGALASMSMSVEIQPGLYFDLRTSLIAIAGFFGGWPAALISGMMAGAYRLVLGGIGTQAGLAMIVLAGGSGLLLRRTIGRGMHSTWHMLALGLITAIVPNLGILMLPTAMLTVVYDPMLLVVVFLNAAATALAGLVYLKARRMSAELDLLAAALARAPDFAYVKGPDLRYAAANNAVLNKYGLQFPKQLIGRIDSDFEIASRAEAVLEGERNILTTRIPLLHFEETVTDPSGEQRWYSTSKVPLEDVFGRPVGLAVVTRDITDEKRLQQELLDSRDTLSYALAEMSDGLAMYDRSGVLVFCNERYQACFPLTGKLRRPGTNLRDILRAVIESGEQSTAPRSHIDEWIEHILNNLQRESAEEVNLLDGRWLQVRTRPTSNGATMVVVSDVTQFKQAQLALRSATDQLKHLVRTDGLTDLLNRRAFDDALEAEIRRSSRSGTPLSLLLVDVDRFKLFNDQYGHPAGDQCLRLVSQTLKSSLKRPADLAARYGGEEFAAILPDTDEDGAYRVAEAFRKSLALAHMPHAASEKGYVTASVGVATYMPDNLHRSALELTQTADAALYSAKAAGRDRVFGTRASNPARSLIR